MFVDTATITYRTVSGYDSYGQPAYSSTTSELSCSFTDKPSAESWVGHADIETVQAEIRFVGTKPSKGDLVTLTHRFVRDDTDYTAGTFEIVGIRDRDYFGYVCALKQVNV
jgi:hypothetical protein